MHAGQSASEHTEAAETAAGCKNYQAHQGLQGKAMHVLSSPYSLSMFC